MEVISVIVAVLAVVVSAILGVIVINLQRRNRSEDRNENRCAKHKYELEKKLENVVVLQKDVNDVLFTKIEKHEEKIDTISEHNILIEQLIKAVEKLEKKIEERTE